MTRASDTAKLLGAGATILDGTTISTADNTAQLILQSTDTDASSGPQLTLKRDSSSPADDDFVGRVKYIAENDASQEVTYVDLLSRIKDASDGTEDGEFQIKTMVAGSDLTNFKITSSGLNSVPEIVFNDDSADINFRVESNGQANMLFVDGGNDIVSIAGGGSHTVGSFKNTLQIEGTTGSTSSMSITRNTAGTSPPYIQFGKTRGTSVGSNTIVQSGDDLGIITWSGSDGTNRDTNGAMIRVAVDGTPGENDMPGRMMFSTTADGASTTSERVRIHSGGNVSIASTSTGGGSILILSTGSFTHGIKQFCNDGQKSLLVEVGGSEVGSISHSSSSTAYNTSSDYRLKENVTTSWDATTRLKQLKPSRFNFIADADTTVDGFLAHEVSSIVPEAITGEKDATEDIVNVVLNADGTINCDGVSQSDWTAGKSDETYASDTTWVASKTVPKYQGIDQSKLVPLLVKTIQELEARITTLENA